MNQLDLYYRAFLEFRKLTANDKESARQRNVISHTNPDGDKLEAIKYFCTIDEEWINEIEKGLVFVEKAIREERQFIRNDGEVVPIEKTKHVDKHSVEHLARHSDFISRLPENENEHLVPDKLYMLERDSDYAVYENRFLYMLLRYLGDFIDIRLSRIVELGNTYRASTTMTKSISLGKRNIKYETRLEEERRNDPYSVLNPEAQELVHRMEALEHWVDALLKTPLMEQVAKVAMIRPPITKTNVLRMDNNFKKAVALYEYVTSFEGDGYTIEEQKKVWNPFADTMGDEFAEMVMMTSFLTYEYGNDLKDILKEAYEQEEERRRQEENERLVSQIAALKKRIAEAGETPESYMLLLEKRNKMLENDSIMLAKRNEENRELKEDIRRLNARCDAADREIAALEDNVREKIKCINELNIKYETDMAAQRAQYEAQIAELIAQYETQIAELIAKHEAEIAELNAAHETAIAQLNAEHQAAVNELKAQQAAELAEMRASCEAKVKETLESTRAEIASTRSECQRRTEEITRTATENVKKYSDETERVTKANILLRGQLNGLRHKYGLLTSDDDFSTKERMEELETEFQAFYELFEDEWRKTRRKIRKDILWSLSLRKKK